MLNKADQSRFVTGPKTKASGVSKLSQLVKSSCPFCAFPTLDSGQFALLTMRSILELQNLPYTNTIKNILDQAKHQLEHITYKYVTDFLPSQETIEYFIKSKQFIPKHQEVVQFYRYYQDLPRIFIVDAEPILNTYHTAKRFIFYRGIKKQLGMDNNEGELHNQLSPKMKSERVLNGLSGSQDQEGSLTWSVILMHKKLASAIKKSNMRVTPRTMLNRIDQQYSFHHVLGKSMCQGEDLIEFDQLSGIVAGEKGVPILSSYPRLELKNLKTLFLKKRGEKGESTKNLQPPFKGKTHQKQKSMESDFKLVKSPKRNSNYSRQLVGSAMTLSLKSQSPPRKTFHNQLKRMASPDLRVPKKSSSKMFASGDIFCFTQKKLDNSQQKHHGVYPKRNHGHLRVASQQVQPQKRSQVPKKAGPVWTPKQQKMHITINQQNVVHILMNDSRKIRIPKKTRK